MADAITIKALQDASLDAKSLEEVVNGSETKQVTTRKGETYPSVKKAINTMFENGGLPATPFNTKALMTASSLANDKYAMVTDGGADNGLYVKTAGAWVKSSYDPLTQANAYTDTAKSEAINTAVAYTDEKINKIDLSTPVLTGQEIYDKSLINNDKLFDAVWSEYNKPVWHIGNRVFVDAVGSQVKVVKEELVMTLVATQVNQKFYFSTNSPVGYAERFDVDWGDGETSKYLQSQGVHTYSCAVGDTFTVKVTGKPYGIYYPTPVTIANSGEMIKSIDKNTLPKIMGILRLEGLNNLVTVCDGAFSSYSGTTLNLNLAKNCPNLNYNANMFLGLTQVTNIDNLFADRTQSVTKTIPAGLLNHFTNVTSAENLFYNITTQVPSGILDNMPKLENATRAFFGCESPTLDNGLFKNQVKLKNVTSCFSTSTSVADAGLIYADILRGAPTATAYCFFETINMTNKTIIPAGWK